MISKNKIKYIHSLELKKNRIAENVFVAEGSKLVGELLPAFNCRCLIATDGWLSRNIQLACADEVLAVTQEELIKASFLKTPQDVLAIFEQPQYDVREVDFDQELCLALDDVQDPGNVGTIVRLADWFGIKNIFCSKATADIYNPKTVQATMGALARVKIHYVDLSEWLKTLPHSIPVFGTFLDGENLYGKQLPANGIIVMGNEGNGISIEVEKSVTERLFIPNYPLGSSTTESLNVAIATAVTCAEFRRRLTAK